MTWSIPDRRRYLEDARRTIEKSILRLQESCPHENLRDFEMFKDQCSFEVCDYNKTKVCKDCGKVLYSYVY